MKMLNPKLVLDPAWICKAYTLDLEYYQYLLLGAQQVYLRNLELGKFDNFYEIAFHYFNLNLTKSGGKLTDSIKANFEDTIDRIWKNEATAGFLNRLIIDADLNYREVLFLRVYSKYLYQAGFRYSQKYTSDVLVKYRNITKLKLLQEKFLKLMMIQ